MSNQALTLDPNTTHQYLCLSEGNRKVTWSDEDQSYPNHPDRFTSHYQVLCREGLSGVCYWEVEWSGEGVGVSVSYRGISRKGRGLKCLFGSNDQSWRLYCSTSSCYFYHDKDRTDIPVPTSSRIGVYLDHRAGTLFFYSVSDTMTLLHRVQTTFAQPLYPGFFVDTGSVKILTPIQ
ncbi:stonustoxin subunit beta-like [Esox lucius]|uniref:stonustoxin subunit beta-like n=1 Tax=Esox lucius TaxID=8010 RepID=UPI0014768612|nr:stonustoxin subunit beta-like [Esox lucius]